MDVWAVSSRGCREQRCSEQSCTSLCGRRPLSLLGMLGRWIGGWALGKETAALRCLAVTNPSPPPTVRRALIALGAGFQAWQPLAPRDFGPVENI